MAFVRVIMQVKFRFWSYFLLTPLKWVEEKGPNVWLVFQRIFFRINYEQKSLILFFSKIQISSSHLQDPDASEGET